MASLNVHWGLDRSFAPLDLRPILAGLDADVIALQETWRGHGEASAVADAAAELGYHVAEHHFVLAAMTPRPVVVRRAAESTGLRGQAVLSRYPLTERGIVDLGRVPGDPAPRAGLAVDVDLGGQPLTVLNVHLTHRLYASPLQLQRLRGHLGSTPPALVCGDFNMWGPVVGAALAGWQRPVRGATWPAHRPHSQIDHVLAGPGLRVLDARVLDDVGSDHRPVRLAVSVPVVAPVVAVGGPARVTHPAEAATMAG